MPAQGTRCRRWYTCARNTYRKPDENYITFRTLTIGCTHSPQLQGTTAAPNMQSHTPVAAANRLLPRQPPPPPPLPLLHGAPSHPVLSGTPTKHACPVHHAPSSVPIRHPELPYRTCSASHSASRCTTDPRDALMSSASGRRRPSSRGPISPRVAGVSGQCSDTTWLEASRCSRSAREEEDVVPSTCGDTCGQADGVGGCWTVAMVVEEQEDPDAQNLRQHV